ncbi:MAG: DNA polymerase, partial [Patescibacteria group bacterium]
LCNQNLVYDIEYMLDMGVEPSGFAADSMIMANVAFPELPKGLDFLTSIFTYYPYYKDEGKTWKKSVPDEKVWIYNCKDMVATPKVTTALTKDLKEKNLYEVYKTLSHKFLNVALEMQRNRLRLNRDWHQKLAGYLADERILKHRQLSDLISREINVKSSPEVRKLLFDELRLPKKFIQGMDDPTTNENKLKELKAEFPDIPHLKLILEERHLRTKESNYINAKFDVDADGSLYLPFMPIIGGTKTSRWTFKKSPKWRGSSAQTISKIMRLMYEPPVGNVFWQRDLSQAEARHVAWKADCHLLNQVFASPIKIHKSVGSWIWKCPPEDILNDSPRYDVAKRIVHGRDYKLGYKRAAIQANVDYEFMKGAYGIYERATPEIDSWHRWVGNQAKTKGRLTTPMGRVRE